MSDIHDTAVIEDGAELGDNVSIGPYTVISSETSVGDGTEIGPHVVTKGIVDIGPNNEIGAGTIIGTKPQDWSYEGEATGVVIGSDNVIREYVTVNRSSSGPDGKTTIGDENMIMTYCHIAHDCQVGSDISMANGVSLAGHVTVENHVMMGGLTPVHQFVRIGAYSMVGGLSRINKDVPPFIRISGNPAEVYDVNSIGLRRNDIDSDGRSLIKQAFNYLYRDKNNTSQALEKIRAEDDLAGNDHVDHMVEFIEESERGIHK